MGKRGRPRGQAPPLAFTLQNYVFCGHKLKYLLSSRGVTRLQLAQMLGLESRESVDNWVKGSYEPKGRYLMKIVKLFGYPLEYFYMTEGDYLIWETENLMKRADKEGEK